MPKTLGIAIHRSLDGGQDVEIAAHIALPRRQSAINEGRADDAAEEISAPILYQVKPLSVSPKLRSNEALSSTPPWARTAASMRRAAL